MTTVKTESPFTVFSKPNLSASRVTPLPSDHFKTFKRPRLVGKDDYRDWCKSPQTDHAFFSLVEGENPHLRVSKRNMPRRIHGLVADYDGKDQESQDILAALGEVPSDFRPTAWSMSFSGGVHMVWVFENPVLYYNKKVWDYFVGNFATEARLHHLLPGFDAKAWESWSQTYEIGTDWVDYGFRVSSEVLTTELYNAVRASNFLDTSLTEIPWDILNAEVVKQYPGVGELSEGLRVTRFWDESADADSVIVTGRGCHCFTGDKTFVSWAEILGTAFVRDLEVNRIASAITDTYYLHPSYYRKSPDERWVRYDGSSLAKQIQFESGLARVAPRGELSECDEAIAVVRQTRSLDGAHRFLYRPEDIVTEGSLRFLNISRVQVLTPSGNSVTWGQGFPWIAKFLEDLFGEDQLWVFISWLAHFYTSAWNRRLENGLAIFIAGSAGAGKTFLTNQVISRLMGGSEEATAFLTNQEKFNDNLFGTALWTIDDAVSASDPRASQVYTQMVKKVVANQNISVRAMNQSPISLPWKGRVAVTMNDDEESIQMLPHTEYSILDKLMFFKVTSPEIPAGTNWLKSLLPELADFAQFLVNYEIPDELRGDKRFGVKPYHHPDLLKSAEESGPAAAMEDLLEEWRAHYFNKPHSLEEADNVWTGGAAKLNKELKKAEFEYRESNRAIGKALSRLSRQPSCTWITRHDDFKRGNTYRIISPKWSQDLPEKVEGPF